MARSGAKGRNRTADTSIFSAVLYRLSYLGRGRRWPTHAAVYHRRRRHVNLREQWSSVRDAPSLTASGFPAK